ncbi:hypothetical protein EV182_001559 [Spiromyces aspiralis]|uniref:Uncharacterized protein n=1 Tax=Spiromyces aspiralis TaxID=68401 RepID=A0ACC1HGH5_9FUNG|nr:hypothetical protein EV182_001559 [Spiromyces aspiralis]
MDSPVALVKTVILGVALRLGIQYLFPGFTDRVLATSIQLSTPVTSYKRLIEGLFLQKNGISPYAGDIYHQTPIFLLLCNAFEHLSPIYITAVYSAVDAIIAVLLARIARWKQNNPMLSRRFPGEERSDVSPHIVTAIYLFNPLTVATTLARSTIVFSHLAVVMSLYLATKGLKTSSLAWAAIASHISVYPAILAIPISLYFSKQGLYLTDALRSFATFAAVFAGIYVAFLAVYGSGFASSTFGFTFLVQDLQPNVGLYWYFFMEVFDEFRAFFLVVFHLVTFVFVVPVSWTYRHDFLFSSAMLLGLISTLKAYPEWGDFSLYLAFLPMYNELVKSLKSLFTSVNLLLFGIALSPAFWDLWIDKGSGNANFSYATTLLYAGGQIILLYDLGSAMLLRKLELENPEIRGKEVKQA